MDIEKDYRIVENENVNREDFEVIVNKNQIQINLNGCSIQDKPETKPNSIPEQTKDEPSSSPPVEAPEEKDSNYILNKDWRFLSIMQFVNVFHKVLNLDTISSSEFEFSLNHSDIEPLCLNILSKLLMKKEIHRPKANTTTANTTTLPETQSPNGNINAQNENHNDNNNINNYNSSLTGGINSNNNNININNSLNVNGSSSNNIVDIQKLNENLVKKINYFYKIYIRYIKKSYALANLSTIIDAIQQDIDLYKNRKDPFALTTSNLSENIYDDLDTKTFLIIDFFRELGGLNPLFKEASSPEKIEELMSNQHQEESKANLEDDYISFVDLSVKQKVTFLFFFCNYCMTFSGRTPLYKEEINKSKEELFLQNKKINPFYTHNHSQHKCTYYTFPYNKDCRFYKENFDLTEPIKSSESFDICVKTYEHLEQFLEKESPVQMTKKIKDKLIQFKTNDDNEKKKELSFLRKQEAFEKAKQLKGMNTNNISEVDKYKTKNMLIMGYSNHVITRSQLNQITKITQQNISPFPLPKVHELTEEEKHRMKVERENLEREKRMRKRTEKKNRLQEELLLAEKYKLENHNKSNTNSNYSHMMSKKRNRDQKKKQVKKYKGKWSDDDDDEEEFLSNYSSDNSDKEQNSQLMQLESDSDEDTNKRKHKTNYKDNSNNNTRITIKNSDVNNNNNNNNNYSNTITTNKEGEHDDMDKSEPVQTNDIIKEGFLIYRYSSNQIEMEGNWYVANDPDFKERISYLFSGSQNTVDVNISNNETHNNVQNANSSKTEEENPQTINEEDYHEEEKKDNISSGGNNNNNIQQQQQPQLQPLQQSQPQPQINQNEHKNQFLVKLCSANLFECISVDALLKYCLDFLNGEYAGYFMYYGKTIEERMRLNLEIADSLVKCNGEGTNNLGTFNMEGYMKFYRSKKEMLEKNNMDEPYIKLAEFNMTKIYNEFNSIENERVIKSYNHRRKKNNENSDFYDDETNNK